MTDFVTPDSGTLPTQRSSLFFAAHSECSLQIRLRVAEDSG